MCLLVGLKEGSALGRKSQAIVEPLGHKRPVIVLRGKVADESMNAL